MYRNLLAEMGRTCVTKTQIQKVVGVTPKTLRMKISKNNTDFTVTEIKSIKAYLENSRKNMGKSDSAWPELTLDYLCEFD